MLVLSRKVGEKIMIGDNIVLTITRINADKVRIGIDPPPEVVVIRTELVGKSQENPIRQMYF